MSNGYPRAVRMDPFHPSRRDPAIEYQALSVTMLERFRRRTAKLQAAQTLRSLGLSRISSWRSLYTSIWRTLKNMLTITNGLVILWVFTLWWGERTVFHNSIDKCAWVNWENWPKEATPHHVAFIADPQLVDPHTYPGRPWPLSALTVKYTDQYLRRSFWSIQRNLAPDSVLFLGDLFDGGREWSTDKSSSSERRYKRYNDLFWRKEYRRFVKIFSDQWREGDSQPMPSRGRKMIASLPGNHDLGFGSGIQLPVRERFVAFFGKGNRVDIIGNHTFVSVDTVSLSAMDQPDPLTGSSGAGSDGVQPNRQIWEEAEDFLNRISEQKAKAESNELRLLRGQPEGLTFDYKVASIEEPTVYDTPEVEGIGLPTILLTHVPLFRPPATPCGPQRERYPPSSTDGTPEHDERNSISVSRGYQYQNVLTQAISNDLVSKVGPNIAHIYSGDDHDYCEISHREFNGSPKEITVKSISWAMGVRRPGFVLTSLWNPIDLETGRPARTGSDGTLQNHLCLLPDQLHIFIYYGIVFTFCIIILLVRSVAIILYTSETATAPVLPLSAPSSSDRRPHSQHGLDSSIHSPSSSSSSVPSSHGLASRAMSTPFRLKQLRPSQDVYPLMAQNQDDSYKEPSEWKLDSSYRRRHRGSRKTAILIGREFILSIKSVAKLVLPFYLFLIWRW